VSLLVFETTAQHLSTIPRDLTIRNSARRHPQEREREREREKRDWLLTRTGENREKKKRRK
jgi:hypothetical protein